MIFEKFYEENLFEESVGVNDHLSNFKIHFKIRLPDYGWLYPTSERGSFRLLLWIKFIFLFAS
jgi:hypothetical protein